MIANVITVSRIVFSLWLFGLSPSSVPFALLYLLCGVTDVLDGLLARKLHTESKTGERLDSIADLFFTAAYAVKILPLLRLPAWVLIWTAIIAVVKMIVIILKSKRGRGVCLEHSAANKLTGFLLFILPMTLRAFDIMPGVIAICITATVAAAEEYWKALG